MSSVCWEVSHASLRIELRPTIHFSYSSGSLSSMYFLILFFACCRKYFKSRLTTPVVSLQFLSDYVLCCSDPVLYLYATVGFPSLKSNFPFLCIHFMRVFRVHVYLYNRLSYYHYQGHCNTSIEFWILFL